MNEYDVGDRIRLSVTFSASDGVGTNPTAVVLTIRRPDGTTSTPNATAAGLLGVYYHDLTIDQSGHWHYRYAGTGAVVAAQEGEFYVRVRRV